MTRRQKRDLKNTIANILTYVTITIMILAGLAIAYLALDLFGFMAWALSGQTPEGGFDTGYYIGRVSYIIISLIIK